MKFKKGIFSVIIFIFGVFLFSWVPAYAHVLENGPSIGAVMHISPSDDPAAGEQSLIFFEFKDKENRFDPSLCDCVFTVMRNSQKIYTQDLLAGNSQPNLSNINVVYTFPEKDTYKIIVSGKPKKDQAFDEFNLEYEVKVIRDTSVQSKTTPDAENNVPTKMVSLTIGVIILIILMVRFIKKNK